MSTVIRPELSKKNEYWIDRYYRELTPISENKGEVRLATLGNDAGIYGAARLILD